MQDSHILLDDLPRLVWRNVADSRMNHRNLNWRYWHGRDRKCRPCLVVRIERFAELIKESLDKFSSFSMSNINLCKSIQFLCASFVGGCKEEQLDLSLPYVSPFAVNWSILCKEKERCVRMTIFVLEYAIRYAMAPASAITSAVHDVVLPLEQWKMFLWILNKKRHIDSIPCLHREFWNQPIEIQYCN